MLVFVLAHTFYRRDWHERNEAVVPLNVRGFVPFVDSLALPVHFVGRGLGEGHWAAGGTVTSGYRVAIVARDLANRTKRDRAGGGLVREWRGRKLSCGRCAKFDALVHLYARVHHARPPSFCLLDESSAL